MLRALLLLPLIATITLSHNASAAPTSCPPGKMISKPWPGKTHIVAPGCYTKKQANKWCRNNYSKGSRSTKDGEHLFCVCREKRGFVAQGNKCVKAK